MELHQSVRDLYANHYWVHDRVSWFDPNSDYMMAQKLRDLAYEAYLKRSKAALKGWKTRRCNIKARSELCPIKTPTA